MLPAHAGAERRPMMRRFLQWLWPDEEQRAWRRYTRMVAEATRCGGSVGTYYDYRHGDKPPLSKTTGQATPPPRSTPRLPNPGFYTERDPRR